MSHGQATSTCNGWPLGQAQSLLSPALPDGWETPGQLGITVGGQTGCLGGHGKEGI